MDSRYDIDFEKFTYLNTPERLRKFSDTPATPIWLRVLTLPLVTLYRDFIRFCDATIYDLLLTGQVCSLERMLNDRYDFTNRRIYIEDGVTKPTKYIFTRDELKPLIIRTRAEASPVYIYSSGENAATADKFIVFVPLDISFEMAEMISLIKAKRLLGKRFKIQRF